MGNEPSENQEIAPQPPPQKPKRTLWNTIRDSFLEYRPEAKPWHEYLGERMQGMKLKRWVFYSILAFALSALAGYFVHRTEKTSFNSAISATNDFYKDELGKAHDANTSLTQKVSDAEHREDMMRQERDKCQMILAPFEAFAIAKYTNAPIDQRLDLLSQTMISIANALDYEKPKLSLQINGITLTNISISSRQDTNLISPNITILLDTNRNITFEISNDAEITAEGVSIDFMADLAPTNVASGNWTLEPKGEALNNRMNHWHLVATDSIGQLAYWTPQTIQILPSYSKPILVGIFTLRANHSKNLLYMVLFTFQN